MSRPYSVTPVNSSSNAPLGVTPCALKSYPPFSGRGRPKPHCSEKDTAFETELSAQEMMSNKYIKTVTDPESGSYIPFEVLNTGASGSADYDRAMSESKLARENPTLLAMTTDAEFEVSWHEPIVPQKPQAVSLAGLSVFGSSGPTSTTKNMTTDIRGEAVERYAIGKPPEGAGVSGRMGFTPEEKMLADAKTLPKDMRRRITANENNRQIKRNIRERPFNASMPSMMRSNEESGFASFMRGFTLDVY